MSVTCVKWGGEGLIYSGSQDRTIKVWQADEVKIYKFKKKFLFILGKTL